MIYAIFGKILAKQTKTIILEVNNLFFEIFVTNSFINKTKIDQDIKLFTYLAVKEEAFQLYGFESEEELNYFKLLKKISGIGPRSAINILSLVGINNLEKAILEKDSNVLTKVSGIGSKIAEKIILELKGKIKATIKTYTSIDDETTIDALTSLGYSMQESRQVIKKIPDNMINAEDRVKQALKILSGK